MSDKRIIFVGLYAKKIQKYTQNDTTDMTDNNIFAEHAKNYLLCYNDKCGKHSQCLRWIIKDYTPDDTATISIVNPRYKHAADNSCPYFRSNTKQKMAVGMTKFFDEMPRKTEQAIRDALIRCFGRTRFFILRRGDRPITTDIQQQIKAVCEANGWQQEPVYDGYTEEYDW